MLLQALPLSIREVAWIRRVHALQSIKFCLLLHSQTRSESFTSNEWKMLLVLSESYPHYCPYGVILVHLTSLSLEQCRQLLQDAQRRGTLRQAIEPIRYVIKALRAKLRPFSLTVSSLYGLGCLLSDVASNM